MLVCYCAVYRNGLRHLLLPHDEACNDSCLQRIIEDIAMDSPSAYLLWSLQSHHPDVDTVLRQRPAEIPSVVQTPVQREDLGPSCPLGPTSQDLLQEFGTLRLSASLTYQPVKMKGRAIAQAYEATVPRVLVIN